ncbi:hypothetical protein FQB35_03035 [Crassaminicella thermophila]|uniref:Uncharacterized protein n=1 Tax=Crassaminicella thermophila TaxID=2599308 RepID=A0A5C0SBX2_CRATE|nr:hypothetical protein [Crassaminicella thermophila]QEK11427.1 hypothetical protein FQB35_03035 [Crassaminicella thermophila]
MLTFNLDKMLILGPSFFENYFYSTFMIMNHIFDDFKVSEGDIIVVKPYFENIIQKYSKVDDLLKDHEEIDTIVITGVGSSIFGTAALAKTVANVLMKPVAGIVSGYGSLDLIQEAVEGYYKIVQKTITSTLFNKQEIYVKGVKDSEVLIELLEKNSDRMKMLVGHSKGALSIANALFGLENKLIKIDRNIEIVTFSCPVHLPKSYKNIRQYLGFFDWFLGPVNKTADNEEYKIVYIAGHTTNMMIPYHMPVEYLLTTHNL